MNPRYFQPGAGNRDRWMISYMDVLTILLIFFVAVASKSLQQVEKSDPAPTQDDPLLKAQQTLERNGPRNDLDLRREPRGLVISLPQAILFRSGEDRIGPDAFPIVSRIADVLRDLPNKVSLVGHADAVPIHNRRFKSNWELSAARGFELLELLNHRYRIPEERLSVASYGSYDPRKPNDTPEGRAGNRRVEIVILDEKK